MTHAQPNHAAVIGGGPAGLMAAERLRAAGVEVDLYEAKGSVGRKLLIAGKGGLNLTHGEPLESFVRRYGARRAEVGRWLRHFDADALRQWARELGVETFVGSSGRVFPHDLRAAPLLRGWVRRLREQGVRIHVNRRCLGWDGQGRLRIAAADGSETLLRADAVVLALGGGSWARLGADGEWVDWLAAAGAPVAPLRPANCGFEVDWSAHFRQRHAGAPIKPVRLSLDAGDGESFSRQGELMVTEHGLEGGLLYALSAPIREAIARAGPLTVWLDLLPGHTPERVRAALEAPRNGRSLSEHLRRRLHLSGVRAALIRESGAAQSTLQDPAQLAALLKALPLTLRAARPIEEAISSAGGVELEALDKNLMWRARPGVFCCGEMLDWEAPTGGYLLTACFASGVVAGDGAAHWLARSASR